VHDGRLRPRWRVLLYLVTFSIGLVVLQFPVVALYVFRLYARSVPLDQILPRVLSSLTLLTILQTTQLICVGLITFAFRRFLDKRTFVSLGWVRTRAPHRFVAGLGMGAALSGAAFVVEWLSGLTILGVTPSANLIGYALLFAMTALAEETMFRGYLLQNLRESLSDPWAALVSALVFGLFHLLNPGLTVLAVVNLVLAGLLFAYAYLLTESLWWPLGLHLAWNLTLGVLSLPVSGMATRGLLVVEPSQAASLVTGGAFGPEGGLSGLAALAFGLVLLWVWSRRRGRAAVDEAEVIALATRFSTPRRVTHALHISAESRAAWRQEWADRRGEVVLVLRRADGRVLLHSKSFYPAGAYRLLSGGIRKHESVIGALHRETCEETGQRAEVERFLALVEYDVDGVREPFASYVFLLRDAGGVLVPRDASERISALRQVDPRDLRSVAQFLRRLPPDWNDWGQFRALVHDAVADWFEQN